jgi:hypothetical protein
MDARRRGRPRAHLGSLLTWPMRHGFADWFTTQVIWLIVGLAFVSGFADVAGD